MIIGFKYDHRTNVLWSQTGETIDEVERAFLNENELSVPIACIFDCSIDKFIKFNEHYKSYLNTFLKAIELQKK